MPQTLYQYTKYAFQLKNTKIKAKIKYNSENNIHNISSSYSNYVYVHEVVNSMLIVCSKVIARLGFENSIGDNN